MALLAELVFITNIHVYEGTRRFSEEKSFWLHPPIKNEQFLEIMLKPYPVETMVELAPGRKLVPGVVVGPHDAGAEVTVKADTGAAGGEEADMATSLGEGSAEAGTSI